MKINFKALFLAPVVVSLISGLALAFSVGGQPLAAFFLFSLITALIAYPVTFFVFAPALLLLFRRATPTGPKVTLVGLLLGLLSYLPISFEAYMSSGPDSGPPEGTYWEMLARWGWSPFILILGAAGVVTAVSYWFLAKRFSKGVETA